MHDLLTKGRGQFCLSPVIKKATAAIFLLISVTFIGSVSANEKSTADSIAANTTIVSSQEIVSASDIIKPIEKVKVSSSITDTMPTLVPTTENLIQKPENILEESFAPSGIPTFTGMITSAFGYRIHPIRGKRKFHTGVDLAAKLGMPVLAPAAGNVIFAGWKNGYGNVIEIDHNNGYTTLLAHNSKLLVKVGDVVNATTVIAKAGRTGFATGVHMHVEVRKNGVLLNPIDYLHRLTHIADSI